MVSVGLQKCSDSKIGRSAYILELLESNRSSYAICWVKCDVDRRRSIRGKYYRTCNGRKGLGKGNGDMYSQKHYSSNVFQLLLPQFMNYLQEHNGCLRRCLLSLAHSDTTTENDELATILTMETFRENKSNFVEMNRGRNTIFYFWWQYMQVVGVRLRFIRVQRDGI